MAITNDFILKGGLKSSDEAANNRLQAIHKMEQQQSQQDAALSQLIRGDELDQQGIDSNVRRAHEQAQLQGLKNNEYSVTASKSGFGVNPEDKLANWLKGEQIKQAMDDKNERKTAQFAERADKFKIPERASSFVSLESTTAGKDAQGNPVGGIITNPNYKVKSASKVLGYTPDFLKPMVTSVGESMGGFEKGTGSEMQALQRLYNQEIKSNSGSAVSMQEEGRNLVATGQRSGDSDAVRRGVQMMKKALELDTQVLEGSAAGRTKDQFRSQGGEYDVNRMIQGAGGQAPADKAPSFEEWKRMRAGK